MKFHIDYMPMNWNQYINIERGNKFQANNIKQDEKLLMVFESKRLKKFDSPVELIFRPHYKDKRQDLDNFRMKGLIDGLVAGGVLPNDNLKIVQKITIEPIFDKQYGVDIEIKEIQNEQ